MRAQRTGLLALLVLALVALASPLAAQQGTLTGQVTDIESGRPVATAQVQVLGGGQSRGSLTDEAGMYRFQLPEGTYSIVVTEVGHQTARFDGIGVMAGQTTSFDVRLTSQALALNPIQVTVGRGLSEKQTEAPATVHTVGTVEIEEQPAVTVAEHLRESPGVDIITHGLQASNVVVRGFNNIFSGALHALTDNRLAGVPSLRVNLLHFIPSNDEDIERMEVVLGPGSALYGPNTANGVLHIITKSPLNYQGTTVTLGGGLGSGASYASKSPNALQGTFRSAFLVGDDFGLKLSGQYLRGYEWEYTDPTEDAARLQAETNLNACLTDKAIRGLPTSQASVACQRVGRRNFDIERYGLEARADWRFAEDGTLVGTYGRTSASGVELTGLGAGQTEDWVYQFYQARLTKGRLFAQGYLNTSDAGGSWLLRDGVPLVDQSKLWVGQVQHGFSMADGRQDFTYGYDYFGTRPDTRGTINGSYEDDDSMDEWGVYLQSKTALSEQLDLVLAGRLDSHSLIDDDVWSPRAALVFKPTEDQSLRFTYNRAFSNPTSLNFFLDISGGAAPPPLGALGYTVRAFGTGPDGYSFQNSDGSLKGMRSPFYPGGADALLPANVTTLWQLALGVLQAQGSIDGNMAQLLGALDPSAGNVGINLYNLQTGATSPLSSTTLPAVPGIRESNTESYELGWTGILQNKVKITADVYRMTKNNFISPLLIQTPLLLIDGPSLGAYLGPIVVPVLTQRLILSGMDPATAQATAEATVTQLVTGVAQVPLAVASSDEVAAQGSDIIVTYRNVGDVTLWGADLAFQAFLNSQWTLSGSYSMVSDDWFEIEDGTPISLNAPKHKGSVSLAYRDALSGFNALARVRFNSEFPAESAGFVGTQCRTGPTGALFEEECVASSTLVDLTLGYKIPSSAATVQLNVNNIFDSEYRSFTGVPSIGRFAMLRVKYDLF